MPNPYDIQQERTKQLLEMASPEMLENIKAINRNQTSAYLQMFGAPEDHLHDFNTGLPTLVAPCSDEFDEFIMPQENVFSIAGAGCGIVRESIEKFEPKIKQEYKDMDIETKKEPLTMEVGKRYMIETRKGREKKYLSFIDEKTDTYYFVKTPEKVNSAKLGWMFAGRGTAHSIQNVVAEVN